MISPEKTRIVIQFSKIDLEEQNDCLYDFISIEDDESYESSLETVISPSSSLAMFNSNKISDIGSERFARRRKRYSNAESVTISTRVISEPSFLPYVRWCGTHESNMSRFDFIAASNMVLINFHSDYSVSGSGFALTWHAVPLNGCPTQTYTSIEDLNSISSPNYPNVLLNDLDCTYSIYAAAGKKIWLEFHSFDLIRDSRLEIDLGTGPFVPFRKSRQLNDGVFVSHQNRITVRLTTGSKPKGNGFHFTYKTCKWFFVCLFVYISLHFRASSSLSICIRAKEKSIEQTKCNEKWGKRMLTRAFNLFLFSFSNCFVDGQMEHRSIVLLNETSGVLNHLNYPQRLPSNIDFTQHIIVPLGDVILLEIYNVGISDAGCHSANKIEVSSLHAASKISTGILLLLFVSFFMADLR